MALDFIAGCLGGCAGVAVGHPFDTVKVKLQTQDFRYPLYRGTWDCFTKILQTESLAGVYRGMWSPMCGVALVNAVVFGVYGNLQHYLTDPNSLRSHFLAGATAGLAQSIISSPVELVKTRMQTSSSYHGTMDCLRNIFRAEGIQGIFKGLSITGVREFFGYGFYFATYELLTNYSPEDPVGTPTMLLCGGISGTMSWMLTYPLDVVKTRFQADTGRFSGLVDCLKKSVRNEGLSCLSRGLMPTVIRAFPTNAVTFTVVTWVMRCAEFSVKEPLSVTTILDSVVDNLNQRKHLITTDLEDPIGNFNFNCIRRMNAQRYFLMSEDLWLNDDFFSEPHDRNNSEKIKIVRNKEADLIAAGHNIFDKSQEIKISDCNDYSEIVGMEEEYKPNNR